MSRGLRRNKKWAWKEVPPKDSQSKTKTKNKTVNGNWCDIHNSWVKHTMERCNFASNAFNTTPNKITPQDLACKTLTAIWEDVEKESRQEGPLVATSLCQIFYRAWWMTMGALLVILQHAATETTLFWTVSVFGTITTLVREPIINLTQSTGKYHQPIFLLPKSMLKLMIRRTSLCRRSMTVKVHYHHPQP
jgi:hypothetical protein